MDDTAWRRVAAALLTALPVAVLLAFWPMSIAAFAPPKALAVCALVALAAGAAAVAAPARPVARRVLMWWAGLVVALGGAAVVGVDPWRSVRGTFPRYESIAVLAAATALVWLVPLVLSRRDLGRTAALMFGATALVGVYALAQALGADPLHLTQAGRAWGTVGNPVLLGTAMAMLVPFPLVVALTGRGTAWMRYLAWPATAFGTAAVLVSQTRGAWVGLAVGVAFVVVSALRDIRRARAVAAAGALAAALAIVLVAPATRGPLIERLGSFTPGSPSAKARLLKWEIGLGLVGDRPLLGRGWDSVAGVYPSRLPPDWLSRDAEGRTTDRLHAEWLDMLAATGVAGLATLGGLLAVAIVPAAKRALGGGPTARSLGVGLLGGIAAYLVASLTGFPAVATWPVFFMLVGLVGVVGAATEEAGPSGAAAPAHRRTLLAFLAVVCVIGAGWAWRDLEAARALYAAAMSPGETQAGVYGRAAQRFADDAFVQLRSAQGLLVLGRTAGSVPVLEEAARIATRGAALRPSDPAGRALLADIALAEGLRGKKARLDEAPGLYRRALELLPYDPDVLKNAGLAHYALQTRSHYLEAVDLWRVAAEVDPLDAEAAYDLALAYRRLNDQGRAVAWIKQAELLDPDNDEYTRFRRELGAAPD